MTKGFTHKANYQDQVNPLGNQIKKLLREQLDVIICWDYVRLPCGLTYSLKKTVISKQ